MIIGLAFYGIAFTIWMFVHCVGSEALSKRARILWALSILGLWPLGAFLYGLLGSRRKSIQWVSGIGFVAMAVCLVGGYLLKGSSFLK